MFSVLVSQGYSNDEKRNRCTCEDESCLSGKDVDDIDVMTFISCWQ